MKKIMSQKKILNDLHKLVREKKPILLWVGAGISKWAEFPLWNDLAKKMYKKFQENEQRNIDNNLKKAKTELDAERFPEFFDICKTIDQELYNNFLTNTFKNKKSIRIHKELCDLLQVINNSIPLHIITTNIDTLIEQNIPELNIIKATDIKRCQDLIHKKESFICKIHGCISVIDSLVFTESEYKEVIKNNEYLKNLKELLSKYSVLFIGYSLQDEYILKQFNDSNSNNSHYLCSSKKKITHLPNNINHIRYPVDVFDDHRCALRILRLMISTLGIKEAKITNHSNKKNNSLNNSNTESSYYISDIIAPGTWTSSQTVSFEKGFITTGMGFNQSEIPKITSSSLQDLAIGVMCFDKTYIKIEMLSKVKNLIGDLLLEKLLKENILNLIHPESQPIILHKNHDDILSVGNANMIRNCITNTGKPLSKEEYINKVLISNPGKEKDAKVFIDKVTKETTTISQDKLHPMAEMTRDLLNYPDVISTLGMSLGTPEKTIPNWLMFPVQRLSYLILDSLICKEIGASSYKSSLGGIELLSATFGIFSSEKYIDDMARYTISGNYESNLDLIATNDPEILNSIIKFRDTQSGIDFRKEIKDNLDSNDSNEFISSINGAMKQHISTSALQKASNKFREILSSEKTTLPTILSSSEVGDNCVNLWKKRGKKMLEGICNSKGIEPYDKCPCGSGEKLKFCCHEALNR